MRRSSSILAGSAIPMIAFCPLRALLVVEQNAVRTHLSPDRAFVGELHANGARD